MVALYHSASEIGIGTAMGTGRGGMEQQGASWIKELGTRFVCVWKSQCLSFQRCISHMAGALSGLHRFYGDFEDN